MSFHFIFKQVSQWTILFSSSGAHGMLGKFSCMVCIIFLFINRQVSQPTALTILREGCTFGGESRKQKCGVRIRNLNHILISSLSLRVLQEAARVPMMMSFPGIIPAGKIVREPTSQIGTRGSQQQQPTMLNTVLMFFDLPSTDIFSTIMDYLGVSQHDLSDGRSLRRHIDVNDYNRDFDDGVVVVDIEKVDKNINGKPDTIPNFLVRHKNWKLILPKVAKSNVLDM